MNKKYNTEIFIEKAKEIHGDKYDYSLVEYVCYKKKVKIICKKHNNIFEQSIEKHIFRKHGCPECSTKKLKTTDIFIKQAIEIHGDKYNYDLVEYIRARSKVKILCFIHGVFEQTPSKHLSGQQCPLCSDYENGQYFSMGKKNFIKRSKIKHEDKYDYSLVEYTNAHVKVKIICHEHGIFKQVPNAHLHAGQGCPRCKESRGEIKISHFLSSIGIRFTRQKTFKKCRNKRKLSFDFFLQDHNILIEFQGNQHYNNIEYYHKGKYDFNYILKNDQIKWQFCKDNNIKLLEIAYWDINNIESILKKELKL